MFSQPTMDTWALEGYTQMYPFCLYGVVSDSMGREVLGWNSFGGGKGVHTRLHMLQSQSIKGFAYVRSRGFDFSATVMAPQWQPPVCNFAPSILAEGSRPLNLGRLQTSDCDALSTLEAIVDDILSLAGSYSVIRYSRDRFFAYVWMSRSHTLRF